AAHVETGSPGEDSGAPGDSSTSFASSDPTDTGRGDPFDVGPDDATDPCTACLESACPSQASACSADSTCTDTITCMSACGDPTCEDACVSKYHSTTFGPYMTCIESACGPVCGAPPPDGGPPPPDGGIDGATDGADPCNACIDGHC